MKLINTSLYYGYIPPDTGKFIIKSKFENVIIKNDFCNIYFIEDIQDNKFYINFVIISKIKIKNRKGKEYINNWDMENIYEVNQKEGNDIYKKIKDSEKTSQKGNLFYKLDIDIELKKWKQP